MGRRALPVLPPQIRHRLVRRQEILPPVGELLRFRQRRLLPEPRTRGMLPIRVVLVEQPLPVVAPGPLRVLGDVEHIHVRGLERRRVLAQPPHRFHPPVMPALPGPRLGRVDRIDGGANVESLLDRAHHRPAPGLRGGAEDRGVRLLHRLRCHAHVLQLEVTPVKGELVLGEALAEDHRPLGGVPEATVGIDPEAREFAGPVARTELEPGPSVGKDVDRGDVFVQKRRVGQIGVEEEVVQGRGGA